MPRSMAGMSPEAEAQFLKGIFFIGAHAAVDRLLLLTRDVGRSRSCFPIAKLIHLRNEVSCVKCLRAAVSG